MRRIRYVVGKSWLPRCAALVALFVAMTAPAVAQDAFTLDRRAPSKTE